jgi:hypothetical protein
MFADSKQASLKKKELSCDSQPGTFGFIVIGKVKSRAPISGGEADFAGSAREKHLPIIAGLVLITLLNGQNNQKCFERTRPVSVVKVLDMSNDAAVIRSLIVYAICIPLAIILGYLVTDPLDQTSDAIFATVLMLLMLPLLFRWYHTWLIAVWNTSILLMFLPGVLPGWMPVACIGFAVAVGHYALNRERKFIEARSVTWSLIVLALVVAVTAKFRGGLGFHAFGDESVGAKRYLWIWVAIIGYFALISQPVPPQKRKFYTTLFLLGGLTAAIGELASYLGPAFYFLHLFVPGSENSSLLMTGPMAPQNLERFAGFAVAGVAVLYALVARYGIEGVLDLKRFWRPLLFCLALFVSALGGFRSIAITIGLTLTLVFCFEGLLRSRLMPIMVLGALLVGGLTVSFSEHLPLPIQRCLAFLPVKISPVARMSAEASTTWRLEIWQYLLPQIPKYLFLGKGLTFDMNDMAMYTEFGNQQVGGDVGGQFTLAGDYHNGPLSIIIPFGIWGVIAFIWFLVAGTKVLWANYKYGDPELHRANTFFLSYFIAKTFMFVVVFGGFYSDVVGFVGIIGFNISLNGGVAKKPAPATRTQVAFNRFRPLPMHEPVTSG